LGKGGKAGPGSMKKGVLKRISFLFCGNGKACYLCSPPGDKPGREEQKREEKSLRELQKFRNFNAPQRVKRGAEKIFFIFFAKTKTSFTFAIPKRRGHPRRDAEDEMKTRKD